MVLIGVAVLIFMGSLSSVTCPACGSKDVINSVKVKDVNGQLYLIVPVSNSFPGGQVRIPSNNKGSYYILVDGRLRVVEETGGENGKAYDCKNCNTTFFA